MKRAKLWKMLVATMCVGVMALALGGCGSAAGNAGSGESQGITVSASSDAKVVPDKARVSVSVTTKGKEAEACRNKNAETTNAVIEALKGLGVEETSIQTAYSNLSPRYDYPTVSTGGKDAEANDDSTEKWAISGYEMTTSLTISDLAIANVGTAVQACVAAGANGADGIEYYASNYDEVYNETLAKALEVARGKAEGIAAASDVKLGKVTNVVEGYQNTAARYTSSYDTETASAKGSAEDVSIAETMPGEISITAEVTATYAIS